MRHDRAQLLSIERRSPMLLQPFKRNFELDACDADCAPDAFASLACNVLMILRQVHLHGVGAAFEAFHRTLHEKKSYQPLDVSVSVRYLNNLYGAVTRGCYHRGNGSDASAHSISHNRQRHGELISEPPRRSPWGYRGGACRKIRGARLCKSPSSPNHGTYRVRLLMEAS